MMIRGLRFKSQNQHMFLFFLCFLLSLMFSKVKAAAFVGSETDRFL